MVSRSADSGYDIYSEWLTSDQIKQLNQNADQYLRAVAGLHARIRETVKQLNQYKAENPTGVRCGDN
jgi:ABC-type transporter Mla subunit MlaD